MPSPRLEAAAVITRTEAEVRRQRRLRDDLRAEGASEQMIERLATPETARKMLENEGRITGFIAGMFK